MVYDLDSIKQQNPIADIIAAHGVALRESGAHLVGRCPFDEDEHPSLCVYPETRSFFCFGCNAGGDVIDFVRRATPFVQSDRPELCHFPLHIDPARRYARPMKISTPTTHAGPPLIDPRRQGLDADSISQNGGSQTQKITFHPRDNQSPGTKTPVQSEIR